MLGAVGSGEHEDLAAGFNTVEQNEKLGDGTLVDASDASAELGLS
jgi:hypothetical protein